MDFRNPNDVTIVDAYPLPRIDDALTTLAKLDTLLLPDLAGAFWQVPLRKRTEKTAFVTRNNHYQYKYMPFGLCNATAIQRLMNRVLEAVEQAYGNLVLCYVDDILIATATIDQHIVRMEETFMLKKAGLKLKASKCAFRRNQYHILGGC